jgi:hypothetical protein
MRHCCCGHRPWYHRCYGYGPLPYARDYGPGYRYGPPRAQGWAPDEEDLAGYLGNPLRASRGSEGG